MSSRTNTGSESAGVASADSEPKIRLDNIRKTFRWTRRGTQEVVPALGGVDFAIRPNEFLSVIGPSGCGKTTLLRIIAGLSAPDAGTVSIDGRTVSAPGPERAVVFQAFGLFPWKTVLDNVTFPLTVRKVPRAEATARAREQLRRVGLERFETSHPHQLSGGMQQRVGLARALVTDPEILLMDEPFGAIDAQTREYMQEELMRIWAETRKTVVFITHDLDEAVLLADRILVLSRGPGTVRRVVDVDLPRPRWEYDVRAHPTFAAVRAEIWQLLRDDLRVQTEEEVPR
ncbi:ABC transporter ATP-binding protein [Pseudonocardia sichuanensis]|uniref:ABC-type quaternary amine transporter n=1 Tax=Pseudonocardia kunmingensis TaxID=630975 RepID=A0A543DQ89_9PSEU|nr:ABC transporter ATP-binding protein [Pseudonocardia kunmingensis]TQM11468.1 NitT/TauT family transport system ATP-binding protein [Pseudonocardia kunmingensis]